MNALLRRAALALAVLMAACLTIPLHAQEEARVKPTAPTYANLPGDIIAGLFVENLSLLRTKWTESHFHEAWMTDEMEDARTLLGELHEEAREDLQETIGIDIDRFLGHLDGFAAVFITHVDFAAGDEDLVTVDLCLVAEADEEKHEELEEKIREMISSIAPEDARRSSEEFRETTIYTVRWDPEIVKGRPSAELSPDARAAARIHLSYAFLEDAVIVAEGPNDPAKRIIEAILSEDADRFESNASFRFLRSRLEKSSDAMIFVDIAALFSRLEAGYSDDPEFAPVADGFRNAGFGDFGGLLLSGNIQPREMVTEGILRVPRERIGLLAALYAGGTTRMETARLAPSNADRYSTFALDTAEVWREVRAIFDRVDPSMMMMADGFLAGQGAAFGINFEQDLIGNFAGEHGYWTTPGLDPEADADDPGGLTYALAFRDGELGNRTFGTLLNALSGEPFSLPLESTQQDGFTLWRYADDDFGPMGLPMEFPVLALTPRFVLINPSMVAARDNLRRMADSENPEAGLAGNEAFRRATSRIERRELVYMDFSLPNVIGEAVQLLIEGPDMTEFNAMMRQMGYDIPDEEPEHRAPSLDWWAQWFGPSITTLHFESQAIVARSYTTAPQE